MAYRAAPQQRGSVPRTRRSRVPRGGSYRERRVQRGTAGLTLLVVLRFRSSHLNVPHALANFGIGPLARPLHDEGLPAALGHQLVVLVVGAVMEFDDAGARPRLRF